MNTHETMVAVDLRPVPDEGMAALRQEAIRLKLPLSAYLALLLTKASEGLVEKANELASERQQAPAPDADTKEGGQ